MRNEILFVSHEMTYTGAPNSLLRMCRVSKELGYEPIVWSMKGGDEQFIKEFKKSNIDVKFVSEIKLKSSDIAKKLQSVALAVCNTIVVDEYVRILQRYVPVIWFIREAGNLPEYFSKRPSRLRLLKECKTLCCVSEYAEHAIRKFAKYPIDVVHNCVEDYSMYTSGYQSGTGERIKFIQLGDIVVRKGYDILIEAFQSLPSKYREKSELYFAGPRNNSIYCKNIFDNIQNMENVHYLGVLKEEKISVLSNMDVVVVASRDESCSLVTLEGCMLSKPLIVTENVGAKYMVSEGNGIIVKVDDVASLTEAMIWMIDHKSILNEMGQLSRKKYESKASMEIYKRNLQELFEDARKREKDTINKYEYIFPYHLFKKNEFILIYGSGDIGKTFSLDENNYVNIVAVVDDDTSTNSLADVDVHSLDELSVMKYDSILIAIENKEDAMIAKNKLISRGVDSNIIKWDGPSYTCKGFFSTYLSILDVFQNNIPCSTEGSYENEN